MPPIEVSSRLAAVFTSVEEEADWKVLHFLFGSHERLLTLRRPATSWHTTALPLSPPRSLKRNNGVKQSQMGMFWQCSEVFESSIPGMPAGTFLRGLANTSLQWALVRRFALGERD